MPGYRALARNHDFTALWVGQTISEIGSRMTMFVFPLVAFALTGSALLAGGRRGLHLLGMAAALLPAGCSPTGSTGAGSCGRPAAPGYCSTPRSSPAARSTGSPCRTCWWSRC